MLKPGFYLAGGASDDWVHHITGKYVQGMWSMVGKLAVFNSEFRIFVLYSETLNNEYIERMYQMSSWQFFNEFYTILRKFQ